jgi:hypothetical protein
MNGQQLKEALITLYGERGWQTKAARALGVDDSSIRRWIGGQIGVPGPVAAAVACFLERRSEGA